MPTSDPAKLLLVIKMGIAMRDKQKAYFKSRDRSDLILSKEAERLFDIAAEEAVKP